MMNSMYPMKKKHPEVDQIGLRFVDQKLHCHQQIESYVFLIMVLNFTLVVAL